MLGQCGGVNVGVECCGFRGWGQARYDRRGLVRGIASNEVDMDGFGSDQVGSDQITSDGIGSGQMDQFE